MSLLEKILCPKGVKALTLEESLALAEELRKRIIDVLSKTGGHLASNLGIIELTVALHKVFSSPEDQFIFDVSHQAYPHKLLTGRNSRFETIRQFKGLSGFTDPKESPHDHFFAGHAGTALSLALGLSKKRELLGEKNHIIPIMGDASLTCGLTLEALNNIPSDLSRFIVILNDNKMSISQNVGAITHMLSRLINNPTSNRLYQDIESFLKRIPAYGTSLAKQGHRLKESLKNLVSSAPFFEEFHLNYVGPIDGHDLPRLIDVLEALKEAETPTLLHIVTVKGKGLESAIQNPCGYHGVKPFDKETGKFLSNSSLELTFPQVFGKHLLFLAEKDPTLVAITPAMPAGSCLESFMKKFPERCLDVGIAEGHAVTFAGGIAHKKKIKVVVSIYATFLQRALDNLFHDVCLQELPVIFAVDRAGLAGGDGVTHNGIYDIGFLNAMPHMVIVQPRDGQLLKELLESSFHWDRPTAIRYPNLPTWTSDAPLKFRPCGQGEILHLGSELALIGLGHMNKACLRVRELLKEKGIDATVIDPIFIKPLDTDLFLKICSSHTHLVTVEEHALASGFGMCLNNFIMKNGFSHLQVLNLGIPDVFIEHGAHSILSKELGLDPESIAAKILTHFPLNQPVGQLT